LLNAMARIHAGADALRLPLYVFHGTADRLTSPRGSVMLYLRARSTDKTLKLWPDDRHELFNELDAAAVIAFLGDWLDQRTEPAAARP
jgi:alpha-beta hydrolase superfamily lysophospholipase